ncbi:MAG TPA: glycosyltransferase family A protein, partial [Solirubrobacterales bacterium]|nr:glycosyltransferase family A protein [Solirubrobacterales bacterium]
MPVPSATALAVIVPATDRPSTLGRCMAALRASERSPEELIVQVEPAGSGPSLARNLGAAACEAEVLVFVDSDVEVHPDALARIAERFAADPELAATFGAYDDGPADRGITSRYRNLLHHHVHAGAAGEAETFWAGL